MVQPYYGWRGHYSIYHDALVGAESGARGLAIVQRGSHAPPRSLIRTALVPYDRGGIIGFSCSRICGALQAALVLVRLRARGRLPSVVHFEEFEPFTALLMRMLGVARGRMIVQTIHAVAATPRHGSLARFLGWLQRKAFIVAIRQLAPRVRFVVHSRHHAVELAAVLGNAARISINTYPCSHLPSAIASDAPRNAAGTVPFGRLLFFGLVRADKGLFEFLGGGLPEGLHLTIAGKVEDARIWSLASSPRIEIIDQYLAPDRISTLMAASDFLVLPYSDGYAGGGGPPRDAFAQGLPIAVRPIPILRELADGGRGIVFETAMELRAAIAELTPERHAAMRASCASFARRNTWRTFSARYAGLYALGAGSHSHA